MQVNFTTEQQAYLEALANRSGMSPEDVVVSVIAARVDEHHRFRAAVKKGIEEADRGEFIEQEEMDARVAAMFAK